MIRNYSSVCLFGFMAYFIASTIALEAIIGGHRAAVDQFKYQVSLQNNGENFCGGGIIGKKLILTAGYCVVKDDGRIRFPNLTVLAGTNNLRRTSIPALTRRVHKIFTPVNFNPAATDVTVDIDNDNIAILELHEDLPVRYRRHVISLRLPRSRDDTYENNTAVISGFGWTRLNEHNVTHVFGDNNDNRLYWTEAEVLAWNDPACNRELLRNVHNKICARVEQHLTRGVCQGDAGGPLVRFGTIIIGVLSKVPLGCSERRYGAMYVRVAAYNTFIHNIKTYKMNRNIREYVLPNPPQGTSA